jgi:hypothetical protein
MLDVAVAERVGVESSEVSFESFVSLAARQREARGSECAGRYEGKTGARTLSDRPIRWQAVLA